MMTAPGAELLADPFPARQYASSTPSPGPGLASSRKKIDFPVSSTCWIPIGEKIPWLIALFKNRTFAGSIKILAIGSSLLSTRNQRLPSSPRLMTHKWCDSLQCEQCQNSAEMPSEKLLTSISSRRNLPFQQPVEFFINPGRQRTYRSSLPINIGISEPTITPIVAIAPITPPLWP